MEERNEMEELEDKLTKIENHLDKVKKEEMRNNVETVNLSVFLGLTPWFNKLYILFYIYHLYMIYRLPLVWEPLVVTI